MVKPKYYYYQDELVAWKQSMEERTTERVSELEIKDEGRTIFMIKESTPTQLCLAFSSIEDNRMT